MENKSLQYKGYGVIAEPHSKIELEHLFLTFTFDTKESIYQFKYTSDNAEICKFLSDNYELFLSMTCSDLEALFKFEFQNTVDRFYIDYVQRAFVLGVKNYLGSPGALLQQDSSVDQDILCFCSKVSKSSFERTYNKLRGDTKEVVYETLVKSFCDSCEVDVDSYIKELEAGSHFFLGEDKNIWIKKITDLINDFYLFCPPEYSELKFEVSSLKFNKIIIRCEKKDSALKRAEIQKTLNNYLTSEIEEEIVISVIT